MEDRQIIELYWQRDEAAIVRSEEKYGTYCRAVARGILRVAEDVEECVGDTWLAAWNAMPPARPAVLRTFLGRLSRNLSINRSLQDRAQKRGGGEVPLALEELRDCTASRGSTEEAVETAELGRLIDAFLRTLPAEECDLFLRRYWFLDSIDEIAARFHIRGGAVKTRLHRTRRRLREYLAEEGYAL